MKITLISYLGTAAIFNNPVSVKISEDLYGSGSISCTIPIDIIPDDFAKVKAEHAGKVIFFGMVDKQRISISEKGRVLIIDGRDFSGVLLDNEAKPVVYETVTFNDIYKNHVSPYGIGKNYSINPLYKKTFTVSKGMSEFEVVSKFCRAVKIGLPFVGTDGKLAIRNAESVITFGENGESILKFEKTVSRYKPISEIIMSDRYDMRYSIAVKNTSQLGKEAVRKRYRRFSMLSESEQYDEARKILAKSVYGSMEFAVSVPDVADLSPGSSARLYYGKIRESNLVICERIIQFTDGGIFTEYKLMPAKDIY